MTSAPRDSISRSPEDASVDLQDTTKVVIAEEHDKIEQKPDCQLLSPKRAKKLAKYIKNSMESHSHPPEKSARPDVEFKSYERMLLLLTQIGYLPVAASMLSTTFFEPSKYFCHHIRNRTYDSTALQFKAFEIGEFYSLLFEWQEICIQSSWMVRISMAVMFGAVFGAFLAGFLADLFGRKPVVVFSLFLLTLANLTLVFFGSFSPIISTSVFFLMGCASGGYMVTNVVFIIEAVKTERERLVVASLNGWPIGMVFTAVISYISGEQKLYYLIVAGTSLAIAGLLQFSSFESVGWLANQNEEVKAACVRRQIKLRNNPGTWHNWSLRSLGSRTTCSRLQKLRKAESVPGLCSKCQYCDSNVDEKQEIAEEKVAVTFTAADDVEAEDRQVFATETAVAQTISAEDEIGSKPKKQSTMTYLDLFKHSTIRRPLFALLYCFLSSSVVSFGFYFNADYLPGNRYANLGLMGLLKFILGLIPFAFSYIIPKKVIILLSVGTACICCWILIAATSMVHLGDSIAITALGLMVTASMDPTWKIIHLYSVELFPTAVRNMARGACNVTARLGSMSGPLIILLRTMNPTLPYWLFAGLLSLQWMVLACLMPNQSVDSLPEGMPVRKRNSLLSKA